MVVYICIKNIWKKNKKLLAVVTSWGGWKLDRNLIDLHCRETNVITCLLGARSEGRHHHLTPSSQPWVGGGEEGWALLSIQLTAQETEALTA